MHRPCLTADRLYHPLLLLFLVLTIGLIYQQLQFLSSVDTNIAFYEWFLSDTLTVALFLLGLLLLLWQSSFALRYKPYAVVCDSRLSSIAVIIPAYNEGAQILATIRSVLASNYPAKKLSVVCVDDGSLDDTWHWMQAAKKQFEERVQVIRQAKNGGKCLALLEGIAHANGEVIVTIDSDSEVLPNTLNELISPFVHDQKVGAVAGNVRVLNIAEGIIPKMMEVSFTSAFDFIRAGQSVYGGVFCTPGALSAYRSAVLMPLIEQWSKHTFLGRPATIGEDRALTNLILSKGHRVVYQRNAVVMTRMPLTFTGLRRMLLRWARSNVRENLVMTTFLFKNFRPNDSGAGWLRLFGVMQIVRMTLFEALKCLILVRLFFLPGLVMFGIATGGLIGAIVPGLVHRLRYGGLFGFQWAVPFSYFWVLALSWISLWGLFTAGNSGWLTRSLPVLREVSVKPVKLPVVA